MSQFYGKISCLFENRHYKNNEISLALQAIKITVENMRMRGMHVLFGHWLIDGEPFSVLFDIEKAKQLQIYARNT